MSKHKFHFQSVWQFCFPQGQSSFTQPEALASKASPYIPKVQLALRKRVLNSSIEILHHTQSHRGQLNALEVCTNSLEKLPNVQDEKLTTGGLNWEINWSSLYLNKEKEENICSKILFSFQTCSRARVQWPVQGEQWLCHTLLVAMYRWVLAEVTQLYLSIHPLLVLSDKFHVLRRLKVILLLGQPMGPDMVWPMKGL